MEKLNFEGQIAPDFTLSGSDGKEHSLKDYRGKKVILYFYPKDNTPGCTNEAIAFKENTENLSGLNAVVLGVSRDSLASHEKFINKFGLPFVLLSDAESQVCELYGVLKEKNMFGKKSIGIERSTFVIDEEGKVIKEFRKVKVDGHINEVLEAVK
ncbi:peroxiredoxin Q/BCP [Clostridium amylolyticum]|uniref:thioredoxin-dependent peroxiredoxin n=1 Tax=Clostridium amylolyticum TaxID=1121298 RepID=A0A1M6MBT2_9CLOT|nr:thioredoxin-dependent thiol peroxidase [Clostridium amylolyticum]SHJ80820.1 peroxiredoxin Q/BCP [Clostridium amylolyticum]